MAQAGMFGVPEYQEQASLEIMIEQSGYNSASLGSAPR